MQNQQEWVISSEPEKFGFEIKKIRQYRELLFRFVRRDMLSTYQQTLMGSVWIFLQPLLTTLVYVIIFGYFIKTATLNIPTVLFYLPGVIVWNYFSDILIQTMYTFIHNSQIFSKVYFPRIIVPLSVVLNQTIRMGIQLFIFLIIWLFYKTDYPQLQIQYNLMLLPLALLIVALLGLGIGLICSVVISRYRDVENLVHFLLRLFMFASPVVYSVSLVPAVWQPLYWLNPLTAIIEVFRSAFLYPAQGYFYYIAIAAITSVMLTVIGIVLFKRYEMQIMDTV